MDAAEALESIRDSDRAVLHTRRRDDGPRFVGEWCQIDGSAAVVSLPYAKDGLVEQYRGGSGEHPDWDEYRAAMRDERRVLVRISVDVVRPTRSG